MKDLYSVLKLDPETSLHCNFNIVIGESTGTYRFITGFYCLTDMPAAFQKVMDYTLVGLDNIHCFLDDLIVVSRGSKEDHLKFVYNCPKKLDEKLGFPSWHYLFHFLASECSQRSDGVIRLYLVFVVDN